VPATPAAATASPEKQAAAITVSLAHGHLRYAAYPLAVGHYRQDVIVSAEAALNASLGNVLRERFDVGRYPGAIGTCAIIRNTRRPKGAIVVGLGDVGELTPERLRETFAVALKEYALSVSRDRDPLPEGRSYRSAAFSTLLVGSDGGSAGTLADSIYAIVRAAIDTNRALGDSKRPVAGRDDTTLFDSVRIDAIEFVELYEDTATRAGHVIATLPGVLERELRVGEALKGLASVVPAAGGHYIRPHSPYENGWWQRIAVQEKKADGERGQPSETATQLKFTVLTDRARLEQDVATGQRALVQQLIASATSKQDVDHPLSATLYQLLVPAPVRDRISQGGDLLFMVDRAGAGFPFELMAARKSDGTLEPLIAKHGILRQFETDRYDAHPEMAQVNSMFVVGNPKTLLWPDLPGAEAEAQAVRAVARAHDLQIHPAIHPLFEGEPPKHDAQQMVTSLMTGEYRIVHIAAHGQYDPDPMKSGVVLSDQIFLSPAEVAQLPRVPELVFLNCCYLGQMGTTTATGPDPRLASSLAEGFIRAGVRAVIAAGWAVNDEAGLTFAGTFYEQFLTGATFGDAVNAARKATRAQHPTVNTWGAYQCYGNPDYRFRPTGGTTSGGSLPEPVTRSEALQQLRTLESIAGTTGADNVAWVSGQLDATLKKIESEKTWSGDGELLTAAGLCAGELEQFDRAIAFYRKALDSTKATASFIAVEQLANLLCRAAATKALMTGVDESVREAFRDAEEWLDWLDARLLVKTKERRSLRGSLYKRMATCLPAGRVEYLTKARQSYGVEVGPHAEYQSVNALAFAIVLADTSSWPALVAQADALWETLPQQPPTEDRDFWGVVGRPDTQLHRLIVHRALDTKELEGLVESYAEAWQAQPSGRQWASVTDHIWFLQAVLDDPGLPCYEPKTAAALKKLHRALTTRTFTLEAERGA
jgi:CHAT domain-containing protein